MKELVDSLPCNPCAQSESEASKYTECPVWLHPALPVLKEQIPSSYKTLFPFNLITPGSLSSNWRHETFSGNCSRGKVLCDYRIAGSSHWLSQVVLDPGSTRHPPWGAWKIVHCLGPFPRAATQNFGTSSELMSLSVLPCPHLQT